ncbi:Protein EMBRYONIC FLOWER 1 [Hirschfeldia incana]|nr:Protein EMBRYONIC FLOWER 1 [Hirschfeldia incana]
MVEDLAGAANETDMVKCDHFSIRGYVAGRRERDHRKCWPFSEESQQSYPLPSLSVPKSRWWRCMSCIRDINADGKKDLGLQANSTSISGEKVDGISSVIPSQSKLNPLTITDQEKERENDIAGNVVVENEDVNCERSQKDDQTVAATTLVKKVHPPAKGASTIRTKIRKLAIREQVSNKRSKVSKSSRDTSSWKEKQNVTTFTSSDIAGVVDDTPPKAIKNHKDSSVDNVSSESINLGFQRRKTRKVRLLSELIFDPQTKANGGSNNVRQEESSSSKARGRKRKVPPENNYASRKLSTAGATSDPGDSESTDSGFDRDLIRGKKKNRRFQVVDEFVPSLPSQEGVHENDAGPSKSALSKEQDSVPQRTEKKLMKKKNKSSLISVSSGPSIIASSQSLSNENKVGSSLDDRLAAEGYFRKPIPPQVNNDRPVKSLHVPENAHVRPSDPETNSLQEFGSSSRPNIGGWLRTVVDAVDFNDSNTDKGFADLSSVLQKDASGSDRKGKTVMVQEHQGAPGDRKENTPEEQNDDITLEIAELMAKNQYERCLPDKEEDVSNKQPPQEKTAHRSKNALLIDLNETYDNETSLEDNNNTSRPQQKPLDFFPLRQQPYVPSPFGIFPPPTQENRPNPNSIRFSSGHNNCQWLGNVPAMANQHPSPSPYRVLRGCNTCYQSAPHQYREPASSHQIWPPSIVQRPQCHHTPVPFNMDQPTRLGPSNNNTWNLNFVDPSRKQQCGSNPNRSMDAYANESSIPALNLLSLMDPRLRSSAPAEHHGNTHFSRRHFPPVNQSKELETGGSSKTAFTTKQSPFNFYSNGYAPEASRKSFPIGPPLGTSSFSFQNSQAPWTHHHQEKINKSKEVFTSSNDQGRFQLLRGSNSMKLPLKEMNQKRKAESSSNALVLPPKNSSGSFECIVNRNPADFTVAEPGNVYMLTSENLKVRKRAPYKTKASLCKEDAMKQTKNQAGPVTENA